MSICHTRAHCEQAHWLTNRQQRVMIDALNSEWAPVPSGAPQSSVIGPVLFIIYIHDVDVELNGRISKYADDTKIRNSVLCHGNRQSLHENLHKISAWSGRWEMLFNIDKLEQEIRSLITKCATSNSKRSVWV